MEDKEKINLFISYSHEDKKSQAYIDLLKRLKKGSIADKIDTWTDEEIELGSKWDNNINQNLVKADIIILVISSDFLSSEYIKNKELKLILERGEKGECKVIPLFFRHCNWEEHGIKDYQGFPNEKKSISGKIKVITEMDKSERDAAFTDFEIKINNLYEDIIRKRKEISPTSANPNDTTSAKKANLGASRFNSQLGRANQSKLYKNDCKFFAIIIVNYEYQFMPEKNIPNIEANLNTLQDVFINDVKIPKENIRILPNKNSYELLEDLGNIIESFPEDATLFVYYSGHGIPDSDDFFWATKNTKLKETKDEINTGTAYETSKIRKLLERSGLKQKILVVDCCYAAEFLEGTQSMTIDGYMQQKVNLSDTFYFFSSETSEESMYPVAKPEEATYFTQALVKAFQEEIKEGDSDIRIGKIYKKTASILSQLRKINNKVPSPIKQPKDNSLDNFILFSNPNKPGKPAIESQANARDLTVEDAFNREMNKIMAKLEMKDLSLEELKNTANENEELVTIRIEHSLIEKIPDANERKLKSAKLAASAIKFPEIVRALVSQSHAKPNNLTDSMDSSRAAEQKRN